MTHFLLTHFLMTLPHQKRALLIDLFTTSEKGGYAGSISINSASFSTASPLST